MLRYKILVFISFITSLAIAQRDEEIRAYINRYRNIALEEMNQYGIPASITIAQGIHESGAGKSKLALGSNNHFGIKCHKDWEGKGYHHDDDKPQECFRVYDNPDESFRDHSKFLLSRSWYKPLFLLNKTDYKGWAYGLKKAGYATNPKYAEIIISLIEKYELHKLDVAENRQEKIITKDTAAQSDNVPCGNVKEINGCKVITYEVGKTIDDICKCAQISSFQIYLFNDADVRYSFKPGELIYLAPKKISSNQNTYTSETNTTYREISQKFGVQLSSLLRYNNKNSDRDVPQGTMVYLNDPVVISSIETKQIAIYAVKKGDTLYSIAKMFDMKPEDLKRINELEDGALSIGQTLNIAQP